MSRLTAVNAIAFYTLPLPSCSRVGNVKRLCLVFLGNEGKPLNQAEAYDPAANKWKALPNMPAPVCSCSFANSDGRLYIVGGLSVGGPSAAVAALALNA
jgi:hypothetical protein